MLSTTPIVSTINIAYVICTHSVASALEAWALIPGSWSGGDTNGDAPEFCFLCSLPFLPKSEAYSIKLGRSRVLDILQHLRSDPLKLCDGSALLLSGKASVSKVRC